MSSSSWPFNIPDRVIYAEALQSYTSTDNSGIMEKLDALLADNCALAKEFHFKRSA